MGRVEGDAPLTVEDIRQAAAFLAASNVPPFHCAACGAGWYVKAPAGWKPGDPVVLDCECGTRWTFVCAARCAGSLLGQGPVTSPSGSPTRPPA